MLTCSDQLKSPNRYNLQIKKMFFNQFLLPSSGWVVHIHLIKT